MQANPERGEVAFVVRRRVDGVPEGVDKTYVLRMRTHDVCALEERAGKSFGQLMDDLVLTNWASLREVLYAFLQTHHAAEFPTPPSVNMLIDDAHGFQGVFPVISELIVRNRPPKTKDGKKNPQKAQAGTGATSTTTVGGSV